MGGHALKEVVTRRYENDEYTALSLKMRLHLIGIFETNVHLVRSYYTKASHGDMDLLVEYSESDLGKAKEKLTEYFKPGQISCNGNVHTFDYEELQIDVIFVKPENWDASVTFFDFDPSGNLMGKAAHKFGLKYGFQGLVYPYRMVDGTAFADIEISKDSRRIFEFLGFDYDRYAMGFGTLSEIFEYVVAGKYFDPRNFLMENLNSIDRKRNAKRPTYQEFLSYISAMPDKESHHKSFHEDKRLYLPRIDAAFPEADVYGKMRRCEEAEARRAVIAGKFNGEIVQAAFPELAGKDLGRFIIGFKQMVADLQRTIGFDGESRRLFDDYVYNCSAEIIARDMTSYKKFEDERAMGNG